ncbi:MAG: Gfo/Idh/MocA family oxidoreductase [Tepidanaerobacter acetatoxydans]|uniref:Gfo/Idh/MocA family protein n=1 Tax=Tepidanaerobacter TaxID=499228 RepID=UPI000A53637E|nr:MULTISPECIES: Gfo/Idh/MocA family oxidoreductase [Tepidanaerobacter]NLU09872.1 Gfo/Idh/MocA family oxidoreductase [Tepidanaerobacter acetatoxydans]
MVRIGIVGIGGMGSVHYDNYKLIDGCKVVAAVCNSPQSKEKARRLNLTPYDDIASMVANEQIDVIDVCTPTYLHKEHVLESLNQGKHVIVEKPMALCRKDAEEMFDVAFEKNLLLFVAQVVRFTRESEILHDAVKSGKYGKPLDGYFARLTGCPKWSKDDWLFDKQKSGVLPFDLHVHDLDLIISLFGKPKNFTYTNCARPNVNYKEHYRFNYTFDNLNVAAEAAWFAVNYPFRASWRVYFERALLEYDGEKVMLYQPDKDPFCYDLQEEAVVSTGINLPATDMFYRELSHFISCIEKGVPSNRFNREQIVTGIEIMEEILKGE